MACMPGLLRSWILWEGCCLAEGPDSMKVCLFFIFSPLKLLLTTILFFGVMSVAVNVLFLPPRSKNETKYVLSGASGSFSFVVFFTNGSESDPIKIYSVIWVMQCWHILNLFNCFLPNTSRTFPASSEMLSINFSIAGPSSSARQNPWKSWLEWQKLSKITDYSFTEKTRHIIINICFRILLPIFED